MTRLSHSMHLALGGVAGGMSCREAALAFGVSLQGLYVALRRNSPACPVCGSRRRDKAGLLRDYLASRSPT